MNHVGMAKATVYVQDNLGASYINQTVLVPEGWYFLLDISEFDRMVEQAKAYALESNPCHCHEGFTSRGLIDPQCEIHDFILDMDALLKAALSIT